jgi:hypothetical protein
MFLYCVIYQNVSTLGVGWLDWERVRMFLHWVDQNVRGHARLLNVCCSIAHSLMSLHVHSSSSGSVLLPSAVSVRGVGDEHHPMYL